MCRDSVAWLLLAFCLFALSAHIVSSAVTGLRCARRPAPATAGHPSVTIIRPVCGLDEVERATLASTFELAANNAEILFCAKTVGDPAVAYLEHLIARHPAINARLLIGDDLGTQNPKLNNIAKGWRAASHDWIILSDSNVQLPSDYTARVMGAWKTDTGLVCAPPLGSRPASFWAEVECAYLNTYQARWQYFADSIGYGFAQGKTMLWRRADLEHHGGIAALASELAEDAAATKIVAAGGRRVRLVAPGFEQPLGIRSAAQVIGRQLRWAQLRRLSFPLHFAPEILTGMVPMLTAGCAGLALLEIAVLPFALALCGLWLASEALLAWHAGWHLGWRSPLAWIVRDLLIPVVWTRAWLQRGYNWRGNTISARPLSSPA